jgi:hypothetical protein
MDRPRREKSDCHVGFGIQPVYVAQTRLSRAPRSTAAHHSADISDIEVYMEAPASTRMADNPIREKTARGYPEVS